MKNVLTIVCLLILGTVTSLNGHGLAAHMAIYDKVIEYYYENYTSADVNEWNWLQVIENNPEYFKYGAILPDMQYTNTQKPVLEGLLEEFANSDPEMELRYDISVDEVPDPEEEGGVGAYSFGFNTHHYKYAFKFAQYLLDQANADPSTSHPDYPPYEGAVYDPPGPDYGYVGTQSCVTRGQKMALAAGYYAHLCGDVIGHNYWVPLFTAESGLAELNVIMEEDGLSHIPGIQSHYAVEANHDYRLGYEACQTVADVVFDGVWLRIGQLDPQHPIEVYAPEEGAILSTEDNYLQPNPVLVFFHEVITDWVDNNPYELPSDYKVGPAISITGFLNECSMWKFGNQFFPQLYGYGSFSDTFSLWLANHMGFAGGFLSLAEELGIAEALNITATFYQSYKNFLVHGTTLIGYSSIESQQFDAVNQVVREASVEAFQTLIGLMRYDINEADALVQANPDIINVLEYERLKTNPMFSDPNYFTEFDYYVGVEAQYFDKIGPDDNIYETWAPDYHNSYVYGVWNGLNGISENHQISSDIAIYDSYFVIDGERFNPGSPPQGSNHEYIAVVEMYAMREMPAAKTATLKLILDSNYGPENDLVFQSQETSIQQSPSVYNEEERVVISIPFDDTDLNLIENFQSYHGIHFQVTIDDSELPIFTTDWESYSSLPEVQSNSRYNQYSTYDSSPYSFPLNSLYIAFSSFHGSAELEGSEIIVNGSVMPSGDAESFIIGDEVSATVEEAIIEIDQSKLKHFGWNNNPDNHFTTRNFNAVPNEGTHQRSFYKNINQVTVTSQAPIEIYDPWLISNYGEAGVQPEDWIQPDQFLPTSEVTNNGQMEVFLNQNQNFELGKNIYKVKAPKFYSDGYGIYEFENWTAEGAVFDASGSISTDQRVAKVVFQAEGASVTATYGNTALNHSEDTVIDIEAGDKLTIPEGSQLSFVAGARIEVHGDLDILGTLNNQVTISGSSAENPNDYQAYSMYEGFGEAVNWFQFPSLVTFVNSNATATIENTIIEGNYCGFEVKSDYSEVSDIQVNFSNVIFRDNNLGVLIDQPRSVEIIMNGVVFESNNVGISLGNGLPAENQSSQLLLNRCVFVNQSDYAFLGHLGNIVSNYGTGLMHESSINIQVNNCTFANNGLESGYGLYSSYLTGAMDGFGLISMTLNSCLLSETNVRILGVLIGGYNLLDAASIYPSYDLVNSIEDDPQFVDPTTGDYSISFTSPCRDAGDPDGGEDLDGSRLDIGALYYPQLSGLISNDIVIDGEARITGNSNINGGLTINPGSRVYAEENSRITVNGPLVVIGSASEPVSIGPISGTNLTWEGLYTYGNVVDIEGLELFGSSLVGLGLGSGSSGSVKNSYFHNNTVGLRLHYTESNIQINDNEISDNSSIGLNLRHSSPQVERNSIHHNGDIGMLMLSGSNASLKKNSIFRNGIESMSSHAGGICIIHASPDLSTKTYHPIPPPWPVNNQIYSNGNQGAYVCFRGAPNFGVYSREGATIYGGLNHFYDNPHSLYRSNLIDILEDSQTGDQNSVNMVISLGFDAEVNYWYEDLSNGDHPIDVWGSHINTSYPAPNMLDVSVLPEEVGNSVLRMGIIKEEEEEFFEAIALYEDVIYLDQDQKDVDIAVASIVRIYDKLGLEEEKVVKLEEFFTQEELLVLKTIAGEELVWAYKKAKLDDEALAMLESLIAAESDEQTVSLYMLELALLTEEVNGSLLYKQPTMDQTEMRSRQAGEALLTTFAGTEASAIYKLLTGQGSDKPATPQKFSLLPNYPNPFNPITTIQYEIPKTSDVSIDIYDILGRTVWSMEESAKPAGYYAIEWNGLTSKGKQASSGVYLISFSTPEFRAVQKAVLIR